MLVLTRMAGENIIIGDDIIVTVLKIDGGQIKLGITAPITTIVDREEVSIERNRAIENGKRLVNRNHDHEID